MSPAPPDGPLVSVVIPTYNQASYLREAIDSVLAQAYRPLELIVVDDGSTDATPEVIAEYGDRLTAIRQVNHGAAHALNVGLKAARGAFICWLSSDDAFLPDKIERQVAALAADPAAGLCCTGWETMDAEGTTLGSFPSVEWIHPDALVATFWRNPINGSTVMLPRRSFEEIGPFNEELRADVDGEMWLRLARRYPFATVPEVLLRYRVHAEAMSRNIELMQASKTATRLPLVVDGTLTRRIRASDGREAPALLARIGRDMHRQGLPRVARALLRASLRAGPAPSEQARLAGSLVAPDGSQIGRLRHSVPRARDSAGRTVARIPGVRTAVRAFRGRGSGSR